MAASRQNVCVSAVVPLARKITKAIVNVTAAAV